MARSIGILLVLVISLAYISIARASYSGWVSRCCNKGKRKASVNYDPTSCNKDDLDKRRFNIVINRFICRHAERICCVKEIQKLSCQSGTYEAFQGQPCDTFRPFVGGDDFRECCDCCSLGMQAKADPSTSCSFDSFPRLMSQNYSFPCVQAFQDCCSGNVKVPSVVPTTSVKPKCSDNFCDHLCNDSTTNGAICACRGGYRLLPDRISCQDINECQKQGGNVCSPLERCVNTPGSYRCDNETAAACKVGEEKIDGRCLDIDECVRGRHRCGRQQTCVNNEGSYSCTCRGGYEASGRSCYDKDECITQEARCPQYSSCVNTDGSYRCECERGRQLQNNKCEDIDECSTGRYSCRQGTQCENTDGSYKCTTTTKCPPGQELGADGRCKPKKDDICARIRCGNGFVCNPDIPERPCQDINECLLSPPKCKGNERCLNFIGTFECRDPCQGAACGSGLECVPAGSSYNCIDINECRVRPRKCTGDQEICVNSYGSYSCKCRDQFQRNPRTRKCERVNACTSISCRRGYRCVVDGQKGYCKEINECLESPPKCRSDQRCINYAGGHYCTCRDGYRLNRLTNKCGDIDECRERRSGCSHVCENTPGSFVCRCREGYELQSNKRGCRDIDECSKGSSRCSHTCVNTRGSFSCRCNYGYELSSDERTCRDKNECDSDRCAYRCINNPGSFRCICPRGYNTTNNFYCSDFDECEAGHQCEDNEYCFNTYGSVRCIPKRPCPTDYERVSETKCDRSCKTNDHNCFNKKVQSYSQWAFKLRDKDPPARIFSYRIVTYGYKETPVIKYYFQRRYKNDTDPDNFEIITRNESSGHFAFLRNRNRIAGYKSFSLEFRGDVHDNSTGELVSRFVHYMYVFVSRFDF